MRATISVAKRSADGSRASGEKSAVAKIEKITAGTASSVTSLSKTGWSWSLKTPFHLRSRTTPTTTNAMITNW